MHLFLPLKAVHRVPGAVQLIAAVGDDHDPVYQQVIHPQLQEPCIPVA